MKHFCNPINLEYRYQFIQKDGEYILNREAADPSMVLFRGKYYLFPSMSKAFWVSDDMVTWESRPLVGLPVYDYAPDVRQAGEYLYFCASRRDEVCDFYRTKDPESGEFEKIPGTFDFWDPNLFVDDDGRFYFYWGCSSLTPMYGVELDPLTMKKKSDVKELIFEHRKENGYERIGEDHNCKKERNQQFEQKLKAGLAQMTGMELSQLSGDILEHLHLLPEQEAAKLRALILDDAPNVKGAWMTKYKGKYYLQYAGAGTEYNIYGDGVYISDDPLGPFTLARNNPYSYHPGGFCPGAGHGSTMEDRNGNWWHASTMRISVNHNFERRVGIWPCGFDKDGELFCNQRYGDWPTAVYSEKDPWEEPEWMLLSYQKPVWASSGQKSAQQAVDENVQTWWSAGEKDDNPTLLLDLAGHKTVYGIQLNFADEKKVVSLADKKIPELVNGRYIDDQMEPVRWLLESSMDKENWKIVDDRRESTRSLSNDFIQVEEGIDTRYLRLSHITVPYGRRVCISGFRVFGRAEGSLPQPLSEIHAERINGTDMKVCWNGNAVGYEVLWGHTPEKLYHSYQVLGKQELVIKALVAGETDYYVRVDSFNECGIIHGQTVHVRNCQ